MNVKKKLHIAVLRNQKVAVKHHDGEIITGMAEVSSDPERTKVRTSEGPMWLPYEDVEHVSRVINMLH